MKKVMQSIYKINMFDDGTRTYTKIATSDDDNWLYDLLEQLRMNTKDDYLICGDKVMDMPFEEDIKYVRD